MKTIIHYLKTIVTTTALLVTTATVSYGSNLNSVVNSTFVEQFDVLNLRSSAPEPVTMLLLGIGLLLLAAVAKKGKSQS